MLHDFVYPKAAILKCCLSVVTCAAYVVVDGNFITVLSSEHLQAYKVIANVILWLYGQYIFLEPLYIKT